jgi:hypothetical protein
MRANDSGSDTGGIFTFGGDDRDRDQKSATPGPGASSSSATPAPATASRLPRPKSKEVLVTPNTQQQMAVANGAMPPVPSLLPNTAAITPLHKVNPPHSAPCGRCNRSSTHMDCE